MLRKKVLQRAGNLLSDINPDAHIPKRPFRRMRYSEAVGIL